MFAFLQRLAGAREPADDLYQEAWLRIARGWPGLPAGADVEAWLFTLARNVFISRYRARQVERRGLEGLRQVPPATPPQPDRLLEAAQGMGALEASSRRSARTTAQSCGWQRSGIESIADC